MKFKNIVIKLYRIFLSQYIPKQKPIYFYTKDFLKGFSHCTIGDHTYGNPQILEWGEKSHLYIGRYCSIAKDVVIFLGGNHRSEWISTYPFPALPGTWPEAADIIGHPYSNGDVVIGNDVWIGDSATIMSGVQIADGAIVAAKAVVTKNIGPYEIWGGNPAKFIRKRFSDDKIKSLLEMKWWDWSDEKVRACIPQLCSNY
jgi:acetyltransferase-like isoleucine patch superfamily enzyme